MASQVSFYTLSSEDDESRLQFACRLSEKALNLGHRVAIQVSSAAQVKRLDELLWQFKPASFLPHSIAPAAPAGGESISVGTAADLPAAGDVLVNLSNSVCEQHEQFNRINEVLSADPDILAAGRVSYRYYQNLGLPMETHKL